VGMTGPACAFRGGAAPHASAGRVGLVWRAYGWGGGGWLTTRTAARWARRGARFPGWLGLAAARRARHGFRRRRGSPGFLGGAGLSPRHVCAQRGGGAQLSSALLCCAARGRHPQTAGPRGFWTRSYLGLDQKETLPVPELYRVIAAPDFVSAKSVTFSPGVH